MNEKQATAILMGNLGGSKNKPTDLITISNACNFLIKKWGIKETSNFFGKSEYMLRQIEKIQHLDSTTKKYVQKHKLGIEKAYHLWRIEESQRIELLPLIRNLTTDDIRNLIYIILHEPSKSIKECKEVFDKNYSKETTILALALPPNLLNCITRISKKKRMKPNQYVMKLIEGVCDE